MASPDSEEDGLLEKRIKKCIEAIFKDLEPNDVVDCLIRDNIMTIDNKDEMNSFNPNTRINRCHILMKCAVYQKTPGTHGKLLDAMDETGYGHLSHTIRHTEVTENDPGISPEDLEPETPCKHRDVNFRKLREKTDIEIRDWKTNGQKYFLETKGFHKCKKKLEDNGIVNIVGTSGVGKTSMAKELLVRSYRTPIILREPNQWEDVDIADGLYIILIDDIFGQCGLDHGRKKGWLYKDQSMFAAVREGKLQVVMTCRDNIYNSCQEEVNGYSLMKGNVIDISGDDCGISKIEKENILKKRISANRRIVIHDNGELNPSPPATEWSISRKVIRDICEIKTSLGFPQCCRVFVEDRNCFDRGVDFFKKPFEVIAEYLNAMSKNENVNARLDFCVMGCVLVTGGLRKRCLENLNNNHPGDDCKGILQIVEACEIPNDCLNTNLQAAAERMCTTFLTCAADKYKFKHTSMTEVVFGSFFKRHPEILLENCEFSLLRDLVTTKGSEGNAESMCILPEQLYDCFSARLAREITADYKVKMESRTRYCKLGNVLAHRVMSDKMFVEKFWTYLESNPKTKSVVLNSTDGYGNSILIVSDIHSSRYFFEKVIKVQQHMLSPAEFTKKLQRCLWRVCQAGSACTYKYITKTYSVEPCSRCLTWGVRSGKSDLMTYLLQYHHWQKDTILDALKLACYSCNLDIVTAMMEYGWYDVTKLVTKEVLEEAVRGSRNNKKENVVNFLMEKGYRIPGNFN